MFELQHDWARDYDVLVADIAKEDGGGYCLCIIYATKMFNAKEG